MSVISVLRPLMSQRILGASKLTFTKCCINYNACRSISSSRLLLANVTVEVPALGESISEGSVASFEKAIGDVVDVDDVIAVIETDKVTVDIKSPYKGTLVELLCEVSDEITVGAPLYTVDTNDTLVISAPPSSDQKDASTAQTPAPAATSTSPTKSSVGTVAGYDLTPVTSLYDEYDQATLGRPGLSEAEMEAVETGGASLFA